jgi:hypothetical protein
MNFLPKLRNGKIVVQFGYPSECCEECNDKSPCEDIGVVIIQPPSGDPPISPPPIIPPPPPAIDPCHCVCQGRTYPKKISISFFNNDGQRICSTSLDWDCDNNRWQKPIKCCAEDYIASITCGTFVICLEKISSGTSQCVTPSSIDCLLDIIVYDSEIILGCDIVDEDDSDDDEDDDEIPIDGDPIGFPPPPSLSPPVQNPITFPGGGGFNLIIPGRGDGLWFNDRRPIRKSNCKCCDATQNLLGFNVTLSGIDSLDAVQNNNECCSGINGTYNVLMSGCSFDSLFSTACVSDCSCCPDIISGVNITIDGATENQMQDECCSLINGTFFVPKNDAFPGVCSGFKSFLLPSISACWLDLTWVITCGLNNNGEIERRLGVQIRFENSITTVESDWGSIRIDKTESQIDDDCALLSQNNIPFDLITTGFGDVCGNDLKISIKPVSLIVRNAPNLGDYIRNSLNIFGDISCNKKKISLNMNIGFLDNQIQKRFEFPRISGCSNLSGSFQGFNDGDCDLSQAQISFSPIIQGDING